MKPDIERYLAEHGDRYTTEALRRQLIDGGHDPADVDAALREWHERRGSGRLSQEERRRFLWWAIGIHAAVLLLIAIWLVPTGGFAFGAGWTVLGFLAVVLVLGLAVSVPLGRGLLRSGLAVALVVPVVSALLIGGSCFALLGGLAVR